MVAVVLISGLVVVAYFAGLFICVASACGSLSRMEWNIQRLLKAVEGDGQQAPPPR